MGKFVLRNVRLFAGGADLTSVNNSVELASEVEEKETTNFGDYDPATDKTWKSVRGGLASTSLSAKGQWEAGDLSKVDDSTWSGMGIVDAWTACPHTAADGALAWVLKALRSSYKLGDEVGEVAPWEAEAMGSAPLARGLVAHPPGTARTVDGTGTAYELGAVTSAQSLYANLHILSVAGTSTPTITVRVESDDNSGFTSATTRLTFAAATAIGGQALSVAGPITDTWWRMAWVITGVTPSFLLASSFGIA
jgi:hypothetical protein